jgi:hypothetical protein
MLDEMLSLLCGGDREEDLGKAWGAISNMCRAIDNSRALTGYVALGKSLHLRAPTPVLSMVAVDLMCKIEEFIENLDAWKCINNDSAQPNTAEKSLRSAWFKVLEIIVCLRLPVYVDPGDLNHGSNGRYWTAPCASPLTWLY